MANFGAANEVPFLSFVVAEKAKASFTCKMAQNSLNKHPEVVQVNSSTYLALIDVKGKPSPY